MAKPSLVYSPIFIVVCFIAVLICALGFSRFSQSDESAYSDGVRPLLVETLGDTPATILTKGERYVGRIEAGQRAAVGFDTSGVITAVLKSEGDTFKKGEVLATLDTDRLVAKQRELKAAITRATAAQKLAKSSLARAQSLKASRNISEQALDEALQKKDAADAEYELVRAQQASVDVELRKAKLLAPFDGVVIDRLTDEGRATTPGATALLLEEIGKTEIRAGLPLKEARMLKVGDVLSVDHSSSTAAHSSANSATSWPVKAHEHGFKATVERINLALSASRVSEVYLIPEGLESTNGDYQRRPLISGELVHVVLDTSPSLDQGVWLPLSSLSEYGRGLWSVYLAKPTNETPDAAIVERTIVEVIQIRGEYAQVKGGVSEETRPHVIQSSMYRVVAGQNVRLAAPSNSAE